MCPRIEREYLPDESFIEGSIESIKPDNWRPHGIRYRLAWVQDGQCRILFDNHFGKSDHMHINGIEYSYKFRDIDTLLKDFRTAIIQAGGKLK